mmetsp:Transcript_55865/g.104812  ORF Transcript_55865/g.104812 Transcript_55865/m.104812 type:complete len:220 (-) Transcript_55865:42-701(-)
MLQGKSFKRPLLEERSQRTWLWHWPDPVLTLLVLVSLAGCATFAEATRQAEVSFRPHLWCSAWLILAGEVLLKRLLQRAARKLQGPVTVFSFRVQPFLGRFVLYSCRVDLPGTPEWPLSVQTISGQVSLWRFLTSFGRQIVLSDLRLAGMHVVEEAPGGLAARLAQVPVPKELEVTEAFISDLTRFRSKEGDDGQRSVAQDLRIQAPTSQELLAQLAAV